MTITHRLVDKILEDLDITRETIDKVMSIVDKIEVMEVHDGIEINIALKNLKIKINT